MSTSFWWFLIGGQLVGGIGIASALWGVFGDWLAKGHRSPRCPRCWYDMRAAVALTCPECGRVAEDPRRLHKVRRRWLAIDAGAFLLGVGVYLAATPTARLYGGWFPLMPASVRIVAWPWMPSSRFVADPNFGQQVLSDRQKRLVCWRARTVLRGDSASQTKHDALSTLMTIGAFARPAEPEVHTVMSDPEARVRSSAAILARLAGMESVPITDELASMVRSDLDPDTRRYAAHALGGLRTEAEGVVESLASAVGDPDGSVAWEAATALVSRGEAGVRALCEAVRVSPDENARLVGVQALRQIPWPTPAIVSETFIEALADPSPSVRVAVQGELESAPSLSEPRLLRALGDQRPTVRERVCWVLLERDPPVVAGLDRLAEIEADPAEPEGVRQAAGAAWRSIKRRSGTATAP